MTNSSHCGTADREPGRGSVDLPVLDARPLRIAGAMTGRVPEIAGSDAAIPAGTADARRFAGGDRILVGEATAATSCCEKVALSDGTQIEFATDYPVEHQDT